MGLNESSITKHGLIKWCPLSWGALGPSPTWPIAKSGADIMNVTKIWSGGGRSFGSGLMVMIVLVVFFGWMMMVVGVCWWIDGGFGLVWLWVDDGHDKEVGPNRKNRKKQVAWESFTVKFNVVLVKRSWVLRLYSWKLYELEKIQITKYLSQNKL